MSSLVPFTSEGAVSSHPATQANPSHAPFRTVPAEIMSEILGYLGPASFVVALRVCPEVYACALESSTLLIQNLCKVPGHRKDLVQSQKQRRQFTPEEKAELLLALQRRTMRHLCHGVDLADTIHFVPAESLDVEASVIASCRWEPAYPHVHTFFAAACRDGTVRIYRLMGHHPELLTIVSPPHSGRLDGCCSLRYKVAKVAFNCSAPSDQQACMRGVSVLWNCHVRPANDTRSVRQAMWQSRQVLDAMRVAESQLYLVSFVFNTCGAFLAEGSLIIATTPSWTPTALGVLDDTALIVFRVGNGNNDRKWFVRAYTKSSVPSFYDTHDFGQPTRSGEAPDSITFVNYEQAQMSSPHWPTPVWNIEDIHAPCTIARTTNTAFDHFDLDREILRPFHCQALGTHLAKYHRHRITDPNRLERVWCMNAALHLNVVRPINPEGHEFAGAYIFKTVNYNTRCIGHDFHVLDPRPDHFVVAKLVGLELGTSPLVMAVSPGSTRIAFATSDRVQVWTLHPDAFFQRARTSNPETRRPSSPGPRRDWGHGGDSEDEDDEEDDLAPLPYTSRYIGPTTIRSDDPWYLRNCGIDYHDCWEPAHVGHPRKEFQCVGLQPAELKRLGVVHSLGFDSEDRLFAWTDRGLARWSFGDDCQNRSHEEDLQWCSQ